jgi:pyruvate formate lyase activating enzyme
VATTLADTLDGRTRAGELYARQEDGSLRCFACGLRCLIRPGRRGVCRVRFNQEGVLKVPWDYVAALQCDPTEKKPLFHVFPGSASMTFGMLGCDFHCDYCQNWITSQALRDDHAGIGPIDATADEIVEFALRRKARLVVSSYNEPLITAEWAVEIFRRAKAEGLYTGFVSNGNATPEVLDYLRPWTDVYKIDLKTMSDRNYRKLGGVLGHILDAIHMTHERGFWVEIVTLVVPGFNDSDSELREAAEFIASVSPDIPWHVTAFHREYRMTGPADTKPEDLLRAAEIGKQAGLKFVYAGNRPGKVNGFENTYCPSCQRPLIERTGYLIQKDDLSPNGGRCPGCHTAIPGIWAGPGRAEAGASRSTAAATPERSSIHAR